MKLKAATAALAAAMLIGLALSGGAGAQMANSPGAASSTDAGPVPPTLVPPAATMPDQQVTEPGVAPAQVHIAPMAPPSNTPNDYPTVTRADYVFGCMQVNGQTRDALERCSCSIDVIASLLPFADYEEAETIMSVRQRGGESVSMFLTHTPLKEKVANLKRAQVESELRCF